MGLLLASRQVSIQQFVLRLSVGVILVFLGWIVFSRLLSSHTPPVAPADLGVIVPHGKVSVEVYYEVLCPDSRYFILKQLYPAWQKVGDIMDVHFKPYGKATHHKGASEIQFDCQHGPTECQGNMVHACAVRHVAESARLIEYVRCMIEDNYAPLVAGKRCAEDLGLDWSKIQSCATSREGQDLMAAVGDDTHSLNPKVSFIPTILLNGSQDGQKSILKDFLLELCRKYEGTRPAVCLEML